MRNLGRGICSAWALFGLIALGAGGAVWAQSGDAKAEAAAPAEGKQSAVEAASQVVDGKLSFAFKVVPAKDMIMNYDAPWKLVLKNHDGLTFAQTTLGRPDMDDKLPGYVVATSGAPARDAGQVEYTATVFVCDKDKTRCFREVHSGKVDWKKS